MALLWGEEVENNRRSELNVMSIFLSEVNDVTVLFLPFHTTTTTANEKRSGAQSVGIALHCIDFLLCHGQPN
eukprot:scaffold2605_cov140-Skeletonema_dohrnii-CCMP3373.AAC.5